MNITWNEFFEAVTSNGYRAPTRSQYQAFIRGLPRGGINSKTEAAMFLAQCLWESQGLTQKRELNPGQYSTEGGRSDRNYYGRGYIQLTHGYNYRDASMALYRDLRLVDNPDLVADDEDAAWGTAFWFWNDKVHRIFHENVGFDRTTRAINSMEITNPNLRHLADRRFEVYRKVHAAFKLQTSIRQ